MKRLMLVLFAMGCKPAEEKGPPQITVDWSPVTLGVVGLPMEQPFDFDMQFTNIGGELLTLESVTVKGDYRCAFNPAFEGPDVTDIATTESAFIRGHYWPSTEGEDQISIEVVSNAKDYPVFVVSICGSAVPMAEVEGTTEPVCQGPQPSAANCSKYATLL
jgi:hypothetical protein